MPACFALARSSYHLLAAILFGPRGKHLRQLRGGGPPPPPGLRAPLEKAGARLAFRGSPLPANYACLFLPPSLLPPYGRFFWVLEAAKFASLSFRHTSFSGYSRTNSRPCYSVSLARSSLFFFLFFLGGSMCFCSFVQSLAPGFILLPSCQLLAFLRASVRSTFPSQLLTSGIYHAKQT